MKSSKTILVLTILIFVFLSICTSLFSFPFGLTFADNCKVETGTTVEIGRDLEVTVKNTFSPDNYVLSVYLGDVTSSSPLNPPVYTQTESGWIPDMNISFTIPGSVFQNEGKYTIYVVDRNNSTACDPMTGTLVEVIPTSGVGSGRNPCGPTGAECETALGAIPTDPGAFAGKILSIAIGIAGGIALILMVIGSIRVLTSSGDQQRLAGGRDMIVAAVAGLLFLIFSFLILEFIGGGILELGFGGFSAP